MPVDRFRDLPLKDKLMRSPIDPRMVEEIERSPQMSREQGASFLARYGGPTVYKKLTKLSPVERSVWVSGQLGNTDADSVGMAEGLDTSVAQKCIDRLKALGLWSQVI